MLWLNTLAVRNVPLNTHPRTDVQPSQSFEWWQSTGCRPIFEHVFMRVLGGRFSVKWAIKLGMTNQRATSHTGSLVHPSSGLAGLGTNSEQTLPSAFALAEPTAELDDDSRSFFVLCSVNNGCIYIVWRKKDTKNMFMAYKHFQLWPDTDVNFFFFFFFQFDLYTSHLHQTSTSP